MTLTNRELAKNPSFPIAMTFLVCPQCNYVAKSDELDSPQAPCPKCGTSRVSRRIFPDVSALKLLEMVGYFYTKAYDRTEDLKAELVNVLREKVGQTYVTQIAVATAKEIQDFYEEHDGGQSEYDKTLEIIRERLSLKSTEVAERVFVPLLEYSDTFDEHKIVVILTCILLEKLFDALLVTIYTRKGMNWAKAEKEVRQSRGFNKRCTAFEKATNVSLEKAIGQSSISGFFPDWADIRKARNTFVHGSPFAIGLSVAEKAFNLAMNAFSLFAYLQNQFFGFS